jgi:hypothetical protein
MDCLEDLISAVLFAYSALEGFGNHCIDRLDAAASVTLQRRGEDVVISQPDMVERLSVGEKLHLAVPLFTGRPSLRGRAVWRDFVALRRLRDAIVHPKEGGISSEADDPGIYAMLLRGDGDSAADTALSVVLSAEPGFLPDHVIETLKGRPSVRR